MAALKNLIEAVEAGTATTRSFHCEPFETCQNGEFTNAVNAYFGDLNAAKALHDALLPGCSARMTDHGTEYDDVGRWHVKVNWEHMDWQPSFTAAGPFGFSAHSNSPARAWLLATLRARAALAQKGDQP